MFTYHADAPLTDLDRLRLHIGDTVEGAGPRVGGRNYSDDELAAFLSSAAGVWQQAVLMALLALANEWATSAYSLKTGAFSADYTAMAETLRKQAQHWAATHGTDGALVGAGSGSVVMDWWETAD